MLLVLVVVLGLHLTTDDVHAGESAVIAQTASDSIDDGTGLQPPLIAPRWSPYVAGLGLGAVIALSFLLANKPIGFSSSFARIAALLSRRAHDGSVQEEYFRTEVEPRVGWEMLLFLGACAGAATAALLSRTWHMSFVDSRWIDVTGSSLWWPRALVAFIGGMVMAFGARWAGGCTSGHGLSGTAQLVASSWLAAFCFFVGGAATALAFDAIVGP